MHEGTPRLAVLSSLFPHSGRPSAGLFIRERMFRVGRILPVTVVVPVPWFPFQGLIRKWRPQFRPLAPEREAQEGFEVLFPRFFSLPVIGRSLDGLMMALGTLPTLWRLRRRGAVDVLDAHFAYPDGFAAALLGRFLGLPVTITMRGTEVPLSRQRIRRRLLTWALKSADQVFAVSDSLRRHAGSLGVPVDRVQVVGNGVDLTRFTRLPCAQARRELGLPPDAPVLVSVGGLVPRKGFHRVIEVLPGLRERYPDLRYLIVGGGSPEGNCETELRRQAAELGLGDVVSFLGHTPPDRMRVPLSTADIFVLATANEGWANVFLEAMACGLPVVTTDVGGNREVVSREDLGIIVPFGDPKALELAIADALARPWDREAIVAYASANTWDSRISTLVKRFRELVSVPDDAPAAGDAGHFTKSRH